MTLLAYWPLAGLRLRTPRLELRMPGLEDLAALAGLAAEGVHDPAMQPFTAAWTDSEPDERAQRVLRWHWQCWADWRPEDWRLNLVAARDGEIVGTQTVAAKDFAVCSQVSTGSWVGRTHQRQGIGSEMRAAVLDFAFTHLGAATAVSGAFADNHGSLAVSRKFGYEPDGLETHAVRGEPAVIHRLRLPRDRWESHRTTPVHVTGLTECLPMFGLTTS
ncbi:GNAT family N-acetyltransferase [Nocardia sp. NPDC127579]|uniref:GNAT family N-acetyltransferase n=1 Tax=Nocardia sp. NPDC127579 TaxID=3345402 RepID=UPI0036344530